MMSVDDLAARFNVSGRTMTMRRWLALLRPALGSYLVRDGRAHRWLLDPTGVSVIERMATLLVLESGRA